MVSMEANKRPRRGKAWPNVSLFGPGGEDGGELLRQLAGEPDPDPKRLERDPDTLEALFASTMGKHALTLTLALALALALALTVTVTRPERGGDPGHAGRAPRRPRRHRVPPPGALLA
eukprot:scaffold84992_cov48-Phaeocystis_antarctica.AAC.1